MYLYTAGTRNGCWSTQHHHRLSSDTLFCSIYQRAGHHRIRLPPVYSPPVWLACVPQGPMVDTSGHYIGGAHCSAAATVPRALVFRAAALSFQHFHDRSNPPHVRDRCFFKGHDVACGALGAHQSDTIVSFTCWARQASRRRVTGIQSSTPTPITMRIA